MLKLYSVPGTSATVLSCALEELGAEYTTVQVERRNRDNPITFKHVNPLGRVGAIEDGPVKIFETGAVLLYLGDKFPEKKLAPDTNTTDRADYYRWIVYLSNTLHPAYMPFYVPGRYTTSEDAQHTPGIKDAATKRLVEIFDFIEQQLNGKDYLVGDNFTLADLYLHMLISPNWTVNLSVEIDKRPNLKSFYERIDSRPAVQKALKIHASDKQAEQDGVLKIG